MNEDKPSVLVIDAPCWKCQAPMKVAVAGDEAGDFRYGPERFSPEELKAASDLGASIKLVSSATAGQAYQANTCAACGAFVGEFFLFADYYAEALYGRLPYTRA